MGMKVPLLGYMPDVDQSTPGALMDCDHVVPSLRGIEGARGPSSTGLPAVSGPVTGAAMIVKLDNSTRLFAGSSEKIEEATSATAWTDRSAATYTGTQPWRFAQFGDVTLATNKSEPIQSSTSTTFSTVAGAPTAAIVETVNNFVFAFDTVDGTFGTNPDGWWCAAVGGYTDWTPDIQTQAARGNLRSVPGPITAGRRLGDAIVAYKQRGMFMATYVGAPQIWNWQEIPGNIGAWSQEAVVPIGNAAHVFVGYDDFYWFDGSRPIPIGLGVREAFFNDLDKSNASKIRGLHDFEKKRISFYYPSIGGGGVIDSCIVYNYETKRWGRDDETIEAVVEYVAANVTYNSLGSLYSTYSDLPAVPYDQFFTAGRPVPAIFNTSHVVQTLNGDTPEWSYTTGDFGDEVEASCIIRIKPRFRTKPVSSTFTNFYRYNASEEKLGNLGDGLVEDQTSALTKGSYDFIREALWHRGEVSGTGNFEQYDFTAELAGGASE